LICIDREGHKLYGTAEKWQNDDTDTGRHSQKEGKLRIRSIYHT